MHKNEYRAVFVMHVRHSWRVDEEEHNAQQLLLLRWTVHMQLSRLAYCKS